MAKEMAMEKAMEKESPPITETQGAGLTKTESEINKAWGKAGAHKYIVDMDNIPRPDWLVEGVVVRKGLTLIYAPSSMGKTTLCLYLIDALQTGKSFFSRGCKQATVLIAEQDASLPMLKSHWQRIGIPEKLFAVGVPLKWNNLKCAFMPELRNLLYTCRPDVLIIDSYTSLGIGDINHPSASLVFDELRICCQDFDCAFIIVHHTRKDGGQMGSNLNIAKVDSVISLHSRRGTKQEKLYKRITAEQEKLRAEYCEDIELDFDLATFKMTLVTATETTRERVARLKAEGKTDEEVVELTTDLNVKLDTIKRYCREYDHSLLGVIG